MLRGLQVSDQCARREMKKYTQFALSRKPNQRFGCRDVCSLSLTIVVSRGDLCYVRCVLSVPWSNTITLFSEHSSVSLGKLAQCRGQTLIDLQLLLEFGLIGGLFQL